VRTPGKSPNRRDRRADRKLASKFPCIEGTRSLCSVPTVWVNVRRVEQLAKPATGGTVTSSARSVLCVGPWTYGGMALGLPLCRAAMEQNTYRLSRERALRSAKNRKTEPHLAPPQINAIAGGVIVSLLRAAQGQKHPPRSL
jgi:hypothetical protein